MKGGRENNEHIGLWWEGAGCVPEAKRPVPERQRERTWERRVRQVKAGEVQRWGWRLSHRVQ